MKTLRFSLRRKAFWTQSSGGNEPDVGFVPALLRRRLSRIERAGLFVLNEAARTDSCPTVFASRFGEWRQTFKGLRQLCEEDEMSPAGFSLSVHNATPGVFSLLRKDASPYTAIAAGARTLEAGFMEAVLMRCDVLFAYAEESPPDFYARELRERVSDCALALFVEEGDDFELSPTVSDAAPATFSDFRNFFEGVSSGTLTCSLFKLNRRFSPQNEPACA